MEWVIQFDAPAEAMTMNNDKGRRDTIAKKMAWRDAAYYAWVEKFPGSGPSGRRIPPCDVFVAFPVAGNRRRDPHNWYPTIKAVVDGITRAGAWPDDTPEFVTTHEPTFLVMPPSRFSYGKVTIRLVER